MNETEPSIRDLSDNARLKLPLIYHTKSKRRPRVHFLLIYKNFFLA